MAASRGLYSYDYNLTPIVDHPHERSHQHQSFLDYLSRRGSHPTAHPNYPDVDVRDAGHSYAIDIELPGVKNVEDIHCQWTSNKTLVVSGASKRPPVGGDNTSGSQEAYVLVGERKIGEFRRMFTLPQEVEMEKLTARLEAGLLSLRVPKKGYKDLKDGGLVRIVSGDV